MLFKTATLLLASMASMASANSSENALTPANQGERKLQELTPIGERTCVYGCPDLGGFNAFSTVDDEAGTRIDVEAEGGVDSICITLFIKLSGDIPDGGVSRDLSRVGQRDGDGNLVPTVWQFDFDISDTNLFANPEQINGMELRIRCDDMLPGDFVESGNYDFLGDQPDGIALPIPADGDAVGTVFPHVLGATHEAKVVLNQGKPFNALNPAAGEFNRIDDDSATVQLCVDKGPKGINGEPHIHTWAGEWFDFQGGCDLVMLSNADFLNGLGLDIHIRTIVRYDYSFIRSVAVRLGEDTLEVSSYGAYSVNGVSDVPLPLSLASGHTIFHKQISNKKHEFTLPTGNGDEAIVITTMKDIVNVNIENMTSEFDGSKGLMGTLDMPGQAVGKLLGRDGETVFEDHDAFGFEWQVNDEDPQLFRAPGDVVYPQKCAMPTMAANGRRLGESKVSKEEAEKACANKSGKEKENCIYDVLALGDTDMVV